MEYLNIYKNRGRSKMNPHVPITSPNFSDYKLIARLSSLLPPTDHPPILLDWIQIPELSHLAS